jgi:hypothetical protein
MQQRCNIMSFFLTNWWKKCNVRCFPEIKTCHPIMSFWGGNSTVVGTQLFIYVSQRTIIDVHTRFSGAKYVTGVMPACTSQNVNCFYSRTTQNNIQRGQRVNKTLTPYDSRTVWCSVNCFEIQTILRLVNRLK